jgi:hypothetical protein
MGSRIFHTPHCHVTFRSLWIHICLSPQARENHKPCGCVPESGKCLKAFDSSRPQPGHCASHQSELSIYQKKMAEKLKLTVQVYNEFGLSLTSERVEDYSWENGIDPAPFAGLPYCLARNSSSLSAASVACQYFSAFLRFRSEFLECLIPQSPTVRGLGTHQSQ